MYLEKPSSIPHFVFHFILEILGNFLFFEGKCSPNKSKKREDQNVLHISYICPKYVSKDVLIRMEGEEVLVTFSISRLILIQACEYL
jgi:hypothetical protein